LARTIVGSDAFVSPVDCDLDVGQGGLKLRIEELYVYATCVDEHMPIPTSCSIESNRDSLRRR
jgi:hypothetical protein